MASLPNAVVDPAVSVAARAAVPGTMVLGPRLLCGINTLRPWQHPTPRANQTKPRRWQGLSAVMRNLALPRRPGDDQVRPVGQVDLVGVAEVPALRVVDA